MDASPAALGFVLLLILGAEFVNGFTDAPNAIATVVSTRVLSPGRAVLMASTLNFVGAVVAVFLGAKVAGTIGKGIVDPAMVDLTTVGAAMVGIILFSTVAWWFGLPTSESHALIAGLTGAGLAKAGPQVLVADGWVKVGKGLVFSTLLGFGGGFLLMTLICWVFRKVRRQRVRRVFGRLQILSAAFMAFSHGSNDGQKFMAPFALALWLGGVIPQNEVQVWIIVLCAITMGVGTMFGGWRIIRTMGLKLTKLEPVHGFAAETGAALTIELATQLAIPLSTTHTISTAIMGVGATRRLSAVSWGVTARIVWAWVLTFPVCGAIAYLVTKAVLLLS